MTAEKPKEMKSLFRKIIVLISADAEWKVVKEFLNPAGLFPTPFGDGFDLAIDGQRVTFIQGGWGKISAAASAQYAIDHFHPDLVINLGTCGGFQGSVARGEIILVDETLVYDILEQMGSQEEALAYYQTRLDLSWLAEPYPLGARRGRLVSADRDILPRDIPMLINRYGAQAGDWESGAIAWVTQHSGVPCLILRGVSDLVGIDGGEAYGDLNAFQQGTRLVMEQLLKSLPMWIKK